MGSVFIKNAWQSCGRKRVGEFYKITKWESNK